VVGGWVLEQDARHEIVSGAKIKDFISEAFNEYINKGTVSRYMGKIHISSHLAKMRDPKYLRKGMAMAVLQFGIALHNTLLDIPHSRIVCADVCKFSSYGCCSAPIPLKVKSFISYTSMHSFSCSYLFNSIGGGQPSMKQPTFQYIDLMYTTLCADGSQLPPVIFTNDKNVPEGVEGRDDTFVVYIPDLSSTPSANTTIRWLDKIRPYVLDDPHLIHDAGSEFNAKASQTEFEMLNIKSHKIPSTGGACFNPCDNNFHHDMKQRYYQKQRLTHAAMLKAMIDTYFEVPEENIRNYMKHYRIIGKVMERRHVLKLLSERYRPGPAHEELHQKLKDAYAAWKKNIRSVNGPTREDQRSIVIPDSTLDGAYWHTHCI
jgi:hypothetical protein